MCFDRGTADFFLYCVLEMTFCDEMFSIPKSTSFDIVGMGGS